MVKAKTCPVCAQDFTVELKAGTPRTYCSDACQHKAAYRRRKGRTEDRPCSRCRVTKPIADFAGGTHAYCKPCYAEYMRERRPTIPEDIVRWRRTGSLRRRGITLAEFEALVDSQDGRCAICGTAKPGGSGIWHVDHDHACCPGRRVSCGECIRGLLCNQCNVGLGMFRDDPAILLAAVRYIEQFRTRRQSQ